MGNKWRYSFDDEGNSFNYEWENVNMQEDLFVRTEWPKVMVQATFLNREDMRMWAERESMRPECIKRVRDGVGEILVYLLVKQDGTLEVTKVTIRGKEYVST